MGQSPDQPATWLGSSPAEPLEHGARRNSLGLACCPTLRRPAKTRG